MKQKSKIQSVLKSTLVAAIFCAVMPMGMTVMAQNKPKQTPAKKVVPAKEKKSSGKTDKEQKSVPTDLKPTKKLNH